MLHHFSGVGFQSTPSPRRETYLSAVISKIPQDFNPLPPQGGRLFGLGICVKTFKFQSTPSPRRETAIRLSSPSIISHFNPLPPQGGRHSTQFHKRTTRAFQSTPSPRRETIITSPMSLRLLISIHSLPKEGDQSPLPAGLTLSDFNPLPPQGGRPA